jgi:hypothetical protein
VHQIQAPIPLQAKQPRGKCEKHDIHVEHDEGILMMRGRHELITQLSLQHVTQRAGRDIENFDTSYLSFHYNTLWLKKKERKKRRGFAPSLFKGLLSEF